MMTSLPCLVTSASETPRLFTRSRMMLIAWDISASPILAPAFVGTAVSVTVVPPARSRASFGVFWPCQNIRPTRATAITSSVSSTRPGLETFLFGGATVVFRPLSAVRLRSGRRPLAGLVFAFVQRRVLGLLPGRAGKSLGLGLDIVLQGLPGLRSLLVLGLGGLGGLRCLLGLLALGLVFLDLLVVVQHLADGLLHETDLDSRRDLEHDRVVLDGDDLSDHARGGHDALARLDLPLHLGLRLLPPALRAEEQEIEDHADEDHR